MRTTAAAASSPTPTAPSGGTPTATTTLPSGASAAWCCTACGRPRAAAVNALLDPELAYIALRDADPAHVQALMHPTAMTIPARADDDGVARAAQSGPVFSLNADGSLHMRYTARTRSIEWADDAATRSAVAALQAVLDGSTAGVLRTRLAPGMGLVSHNVLHDRSAFDDDPAHPRLLYRARFLDRATPPARPRG
jgi:hypothetical protein